MDGRVQLVKKPLDAVKRCSILEKFESVAGIT
jgi:hypothetical protein